MVLMVIMMMKRRIKDQGPQVGYDHNQHQHFHPPYPKILSAPDVCLRWRVWALLFTHVSSFPAPTLQWDPLFPIFDHTYKVNHLARSEITLTPESKSFRPNHNPHALLLGHQSIFNTDLHFRWGRGLSGSPRVLLPGEFQQSIHKLVFSKRKVFVSAVHLCISYLDRWSHSILHVYLICCIFCICISYDTGILTDELTAFFLLVDWTPPRTFIQLCLDGEADHVFRLLFLLHNNNNMYTTITQ